MTETVHSAGGTIYRAATRRDPRGGDFAAGRRVVDQMGFGVWWLHA